MTARDTVENNTMTITVNKSILSGSIVGENIYSNNKNKMITIRYVDHFLFCMDDINNSFINIIKNRNSTFKTPNTLAINIINSIYVVKFVYCHTMKYTCYKSYCMDELHSTYSNIYIAVLVSFYIMITSYAFNNMVK